jgi:cardiolipin synthase
VSTLDEVVSRIAAEEPLAVVGVVDQNRWPQLDFPTFKDVTTVSAAVSPDCSFRLVENAVKSANSTIDFYIYNVSADYLLQLLKDAKDRGVKIRIMYDVMDTSGNERQKVQALKVEAKEAPSSGRRKVFTVCHQKFMVIDRRTVLIESANWATTSIPEVRVPGKFKKGNREWLLRVDHEGLAAWYANLFQEDWEIPELEAPSGVAVAPLEVTPLGPVPMPLAAVRVPDQVFDIETPKLQAPAKITPITSPDNYFQAVKRLIGEAQESIFVQQQSIKAGGPKTKGILEALAKRKGQVEIRIVVSPKFTWQDSVDSLKAAGLDDCLRSMNLASFTHLHNKGLVFDRKIAIVTSTNWTENSVARAREAGMVVECPEIASYFAKVCDLDWNTGLDPADVPAHLASIEATLAETPVEEQIEIHPADLRVDLS